MVQTHSMATINQEIRNPSNALERQVQTLAAVVKRLTQHNQELEQQLNQRNKQGQCNELDVDEQSHLPIGDRQKREDQDKSNIPNRRDGPEDTSHPSKIEANAMHMAQDMQMMKEKMDMMMNATRGRVSTNLDKLVHRMDSPFTT